MLNRDMDGLYKTQIKPQEIKKNALSENMKNTLDEINDINAEEKK